MCGRGQPATTTTLAKNIETATHAKLHACMLETARVCTPVRTVVSIFLARVVVEAEEGGLEPSAEGRTVFQLFSYSSSSEGFDKESSSSSGSDDDASESESEDESDI